MAWYAWLMVGIALGAGAFLAVGLLLGAADDRATTRREAIQRYQHRAERQLDQLTLDTLQRMLDVVRSGRAS